ncbi:MAG: alpha/beta hydrolase [Candidatus Marinimicrobia bacterium]|nr:alpha/beta hydrolase [Candidatus Neomarinimicrobiota bacterium]
MKKFGFVFLLFFILGYGEDIEYKVRDNLRYYSNEIYQDPYAAQQCVLDIYYPENIDNFPTLVWFHGGGLSGGDKFIPEGLKEQGIAVVAVKYRLHPQVKCPVYIEDAAAAVAWTFKEIENFGGDAKKIFISGHSAGGYLASMVGLDKAYLEKFGLDANDIAGLIPLSGHTITHFTVRAERGIDGKQPIVDEFAPLYHCRPDCPPLLLITGDRELELLGRYEENAYMARMMKVNGHQETRIMELDGYDHGMIEPSLRLILNEIGRVVNLKKNGAGTH